MVTPVETLGYVAACGTTFAFLPQALRVWRERSAGDLSLAMYAIMLTGILLWIVYGVLIRSAPLVAANIVSFALAGVVFAGALRFRRPRR